MWKKLSNYDFNCFNIEDIGDKNSFSANEFFVTSSSYQELKKIIDNNEEDDETKIKFLVYLSNNDKSFDESELALKSLFQIHVGLSYGVLMGRGDRFVSKGYTYGFLGDSDLTSIDDGIIFDEKNLEKEISDVINFKNNEWVLAYKKNNIFGEFKGYIFTNFRLISLRGENGTFSLYWKDIKSINKKKFGKILINNQYEFVFGDFFYEIVESMIEYDFMEYPLIVRGERLFRGEFGILSFDRYTVKQYNAYVEELKNFQTNQNLSKPYIEVKDKKTTQYEISEGKIIKNDIGQKIAKIEAHPKKEYAYIIRNLTEKTWNYTIANKKYTIEPNRARVLMDGVRIAFDNLEISFKKNI